MTQIQSNIRRGKRAASAQARCLAVMYHYVHHRQPSDHQGYHALSPDRFEAQLDELCRTCEPVGWDSLHAWSHRRGSLPGSSFLLTFDDGLKDHVRVVAPILRQRGIKGLFFVPGAVLGGERMLTAHALHLLMEQLGEARLRDELIAWLRRNDSGVDWHSRVNIDAALSMYHYEPRERALFKYLITMVLPIPLRTGAIQELFRKHVGLEAEWNAKWYMNADDVRSLVAEGHAIGGHGFAHEPLARMSPNERRIDLQRCSRTLNELLGRLARPLSFPYGSFDLDTCEAARKSGFVAAFTTKERWITAHDDSHQWPRVDTIRVSDALGETHATIPRPSISKPRPGPSEPGAQATGLLRDLSGAPPEPQSRISEPRPQPSAPSSRRDLLTRFLNAYWLRPENALWMALRSQALSKCQLVAPTIDVCCGDGIFSFLHAGGVLDPSFDVFRAVGRLDEVRECNADMFDHAPDALDVPIASPPRYRIHTGLDLKDALLAKARCLGFYHQLIGHNTNDRLPFGDEVFQTVYCNSAYWVENIDEFLRELGRITRPDGRVILQVKLDSLRRYNLDAFRDQLGDQFLSIIARGRLDSWPTLCDRTTWERRFTVVGFHVESASSFVTRTHAHLWDIGLRPLAPLLVRLANGVEPAERAAIKCDWVELCLDLLLPFFDPLFDLFEPSDEPAEIQYVLSRT